MFCKHTQNLCCERAIFCRQFSYGVNRVNILRTILQQSFNLGTAHTKSVEQSWQELFDTCTKNRLFQLYRVSHFKVSESKSFLQQVISIFMIFHGAYYVHHIITFCFLPYFSKRYSEGGSIELFFRILNFFSNFFSKFFFSHFLL